MRRGRTGLDGGYRGGGQNEEEHTGEHDWQSVDRKCNKEYACEENERRAEINSGRKRKRGRTWG